MSTRPDIGAVLDDGPTFTTAGLAALKANRKKLTGEMPAGDYDRLGDWAHGSGASRIALVVAALRHVYADPEARVAVEEAAIAYTRELRAR